MHLQSRRSPRIVAETVRRSLEMDIRYGEKAGISWFPSPASVVLSEAERDSVVSDLADVWQWYEEWNRIYLESVDGREPGWIARMAEYGLAPHEVEVQRLVAAARLRPLTCRLEYMYHQGQRRIAEVQWVSGGLGLFCGVDHLYRSVDGTYLAGHQRQDPLADGLLRVLANAPTARAGACAGSSRSVLVAVRNSWLPAERFLTSRATELGYRLTAVDRRDVQRAIDAGDVGLVYGQGYTSFLTPRALRELATAALAGTSGTEAPLNWLYRQKWGLALLHCAEYAARFPQRLRAVVPPTVLLNFAKPGFAALAESDPAFAALADLARLRDVLVLPGSTRANLVVKCGAGVGGLHSNGRGVFRLGGSRSAAERTVTFVEERIALGEPWLLQPFSSSSVPAPVCTQANGLVFADATAHVKVMAFGGWQPGQAAPVLLGALANYGRHWKVGGRSPGVDRDGSEMGTSFTDVLVTHEMRG